MLGYRGGTQGESGMGALVRQSAAVREMRKSGRRSSSSNSQR